MSASPANVNHLEPLQQNAVEEEQERTRGKVLELLGKSNISMEVSLVTSIGVGDIDYPLIRQTPEAKHPEILISKKSSLEHLLVLNGAMEGLDRMKGSVQRAGSCRGGS